MQMFEKENLNTGEHSEIKKPESFVLRLRGKKG